VEATAAGLAVLEQSPSLLQERFALRFNNLQDWEQTQLLASLQRIAALMDAEEIDAAPVLSSGSVLATAKAVDEVLEPEIVSGVRLSAEAPAVVKISST